MTNHKNKLRALSALIVALFIAAIFGGTYLGSREVHAQGIVVVSTQGDVTLTGAGNAIAVGSGSVRWVDIFPLAANSAAIRCADSTVSASRGGPLAAGGAYRFRSDSQNLMFDLSTLFCAGANGDKFAIIKGAN